MGLFDSDRREFKAAWKQLHFAEANLGAGVMDLYLSRRSSPSESFAAWMRNEWLLDRCVRGLSAETWLSAQMTAASSGKSRAWWIARQAWRDEVEDSGRSSCVLLATADGGDTWSAQDLGSTTHLNAIAFADAAHGWAVGGDFVDAKILATTDGGGTWNEQKADACAHLWGVAFADAAHGWAVGSCGTILATRDGVTWSAQDSGKAGRAANLFAVAFADASHGWVVGSDGTILATDDGGDTWSAEDSESTAQLYVVALADASHGWAVGSYYGEAAILTKRDGVVGWRKAASQGIHAILYGAAFSDDAHGWAVGNEFDNSCLTLRDGLGDAIILDRGRDDVGAQWRKQSIGSMAHLHAVAFADASHGWVVGSGGTILATADGGDTWSAQDSGSRANLNGVAFTDASHGLVV